MLWKAWTGSSWKNPNVPSEPVITKRYRSVYVQHIQTSRPALRHCNMAPEKNQDAHKDMTKVLCLSLQFHDFLSLSVILSVAPSILQMRHIHFWWCARTTQHNEVMAATRGHNEWQQHRQTDAESLCLGLLPSLSARPPLICWVVYVF